MQDSADQQQSYQVQLRHLLDTHLAPLLKDEWKGALSLFEAGAQPSSSSDGLDVVVVWMRSSDIVQHARSMLDSLVVDPVERIPGTGTGDPRYNDNTVMVRLYKRADSTDLLIHLFQIFGENDQDEAQRVLEEITSYVSEHKPN